jgi:hypothetical protein
MGQRLYGGAWSEPGPFPILSAPDAALRSHPCVALSSGQVEIIVAVSSLSGKRPCVERPNS